MLACTTELCLQAASGRASHANLTAKLIEAESRAAAGEQELDSVGNTLHDDVTAMAAVRKPRISHNSMLTLIRK